MLDKLLKTKARFFDRDGNEVDSHDHEDAYYTRVGNIRTRRDGPAQITADGGKTWKDIERREQAPE